MNQLLAKGWELLSLPKRLQLAVMRLTQDEFLIGVTGVILNKNNEVLLCKHTYRGKGTWSLPGGYIKGREHPREGLTREIEEETGFIVRIDKDLRIRTDRETARLDISLLGNFVGGEFRPSDEVSEARFFAFEDLPILSQNQLLLISSVMKKRPTEKISPPNSILKKIQKFLIK